MSKIYGYFICAKPSASLQSLENMFYHPFLGFQDIETAEEFASLRLSREYKVYETKSTAAIVSIDSSEFVSPLNPWQITMITEDQRQRLTIEKQMVVSGEKWHPRTRSGTDTTWVNKTIELCYASLLKRREEAALSAEKEKAEQTRKAQEALMKEQKQKQHEQDVLSRCMPSPHTATYIHYGSATYDPQHEAHEEILQLQGKPNFAFWAVNQNTPDYNNRGEPATWRAKLKGVLDDRSNLFGVYYDPTQKVRFTLTPEAKILYAHTHADMQWLQETYPLDTENGIDYTKVAKDFDGILYDYDALGNQYGVWDVNSLAVFKSEVIKTLPTEPTVTVYGAQFIEASEIETTNNLDYRPRNAEGLILNEQQEREQGRCMEVFASTQDIRHEFAKRPNVVGVIMYKAEVPLAEFEQWEKQDNGSFGTKQVPFFSYSIPTCAIQGASNCHFITGLSPDGMLDMLIIGELDHVWHRPSSFDIEADNFEDATVPFYNEYSTLYDATLDEHNIDIE